MRCKYFIAITRKRATSVMFSSFVLIDVFRLVKELSCALSVYHLCASLVPTGCVNIMWIGWVQFGGKVMVFDDDS